MLFYSATVAIPTGTKISIIIPTFNEQLNISKLVKHLYDCQYGYIEEVIVVDGGSEDLTLSEAKRAGAKVVESKYRGRSIQMHEGARNAIGDVLYFLHADTFPPECFDKHIVASINHKRSWGKFRLQFDDPHWLLRLIAWFTRYNWRFYTFGDQSLFVKKEIYFSIGGFNTKMKVFEDTDLGNRLANVSSGIVMPAEVTTSSRRFKENGTTRLTLIYIYLLFGYLLGVSNTKLSKNYQQWIK